MIRRPPRSTHSAYRRQRQMCIRDRGKQAGIRAAGQACVHAGAGGRQPAHLAACLLYTSPSPRD
eukprot:4202718-Alexandrium_andersonii.AAC.1